MKKSAPKKFQREENYSIAGALDDALDFKVKKLCVLGLTSFYEKIKSLKLKKMFFDET